MSDSPHPDASLGNAANHDAAHHDLPPSGQRVTIVAHRGDSAAYRENTLVAMRSAVAAGADRVEFDVRTTADGASVVLHDLTLLRLWGVGAFIGDLTWAQVAQVGYADLRIPRLLEVLKEFIGTGVGLLIDVPSVADAQAAWAVVEPFVAAGADLDVHWCGEVAAMIEIRRCCPGAIIYLATADGSPDAQTLMALRPTYLRMDSSLATGQVVLEAHAMGLGVAVRTVNDPLTMRHLLRVGVDSITTDEIRTLQHVLHTWEAADAPGAGHEVISQEPAEELGAPQPSAQALQRRVATELAHWATGYLRAHRWRPGSPPPTDDDVRRVAQQVQQRVRAVIGQVFPTDAVVGAGEGDPPRLGGPTWYVDPLAGARSYRHDLAGSSFSLTLVVDDEPQLAVLADPWRGEVMWGARGQGAYLDEARLAASDDLEDSVVLMPEPSAPSVPDEAAEPGPALWVRQLTAHGVAVRVVGSTGLALASVAAGRATAAVIMAFHPVAHLAGVMLVREAGGRWYDAAGEQLPGIPAAGSSLVVVRGLPPHLAQELARYCGRSITGSAEASGCSAG